MIQPGFEVGGERVKILFRLVESETLCLAQFRRVVEILQDSFLPLIEKGYPIDSYSPSNFGLYEKGRVATPEENAPTVACILAPEKTSMLEI